MKTLIQIEELLERYTPGKNGIPWMTNRRPRATKVILINGRAGRQPNTSTCHGPYGRALICRPMSLEHVSA